MATRGRKSTASQKVVAIGATNARLQPPEHVPLDDDMRRVWDEIVNSLPADYFRPGDGPLLAAYCVATVFFVRAMEEVQAHGPMILNPDNGRYYANPAQQLLVTQTSAMAGLAVKLRLCPSARYSTKSASTKTDNSTRGKKPWEATG